MGEWAIKGNGGCCDRFIHGDTLEHAVRTNLRVIKDRGYQIGDVAGARIDAITVTRWQHPYPWKIEVTATGGAQGGQFRSRPVRHRDPRARQHGVSR